MMWQNNKKRALARFYYERLMTSIVIEPIGVFKQHFHHQENHQTQHNIFVPCLDSDKLSFSFEYFEDDVNFLSDAKAIIDEFLALTIQDRNKMSFCVVKNCQEFLEAIEYDDCDEPLHELIKNDDVYGIWQYVEPTSVSIRRNDETGEMFLMVYCDCQ